MRKSENQASIIIYPGFIATYYTFYILGLQRLFPDANLRFAECGFPLRQVSHLAFVYKGKRYLIDATDFPTVDQPALEWCDTCGKINIKDPLGNDSFSAKIMAIGPSFGIRLWSLPIAMPLGLANFFKGRLKLKYFRMQMGAYFHQYASRLPETYYSYEEPQEDYIFAINSYWRNENTCNELRRRFIVSATKMKDITFEGGFFNSKPIDNPLFKGLQMSKSYKLSEYLSKTKKSLLVFNTPAVKGCIGWKLAEYLALGKAIISTPIAQQLPAPLHDREQIHYVDGSEKSVSEAIRLIRDDKEYRRYLENNARKYYEEYLQPESVMSRLILEKNTP